MIVIVQDLTTGGGERITAEFLSRTKESVHLYSSKSIQSRINIKTTVIRKWNTLALVLLSFKVLLSVEKTTPIVVVLTKPIIIFGLMNIIFRRRLFLYEHCDPFLLYFNRCGAFNLFKSQLLKIAFKFNKLIVVTHIVKRKLINKINLNPQNIHVLQNPCTRISDRLKNIEMNNPTLKSVYLIIGRNSPEKRLDEAISYYCDNIKDCTTELWLVSNTTVIFKDVDHSFVDFDALNGYVLYNQITYRPCLINFSVNESFSLVIAEFLASKLSVLSEYSETLEALWSSYRGFHLIGSKKFDEVRLKHYRPVTHAEFETNLLRILE